MAVLGAALGAAVKSELEIRQITSPIPWGCLRLVSVVCSEFGHAGLDDLDNSFRHAIRLWVKGTGESMSCAELRQQGVKGSLKFLPTICEHLACYTPDGEYSVLVDSGSGS